MERTDKVKICLGVLLVLIAVRLVLGFFPTPLEFSPYDPGAEAGELQTVDVADADLSLCMIFTSSGQMPRYFYRFRTESGEEGLLTRASVKKNAGDKIGDDYLEILDMEERIFNFAGLTYRLRDPDAIPLEEQETFYAQLTFPEEELVKYGGDKAAAYRALSATAALELYSDDQRTNPHPAAFWVSLATMATFCVMLSVLLKEYFGGKRKRPKGETEEETEE